MTSEMPIDGKQSPARATCDECHKRPGEVVIRDTITIDGEAVPFVYRMCQWCRGAYHRRKPANWRRRDPLPQLKETQDA